MTAAAAAAVAVVAAAVVVVVVAAAAAVVVVVVVVVAAAVVVVAVAAGVHGVQMLGDEYGEAAGVSDGENAVAFVGETDGGTVIVVVMVVAAVVLVVVIVGLDGDGTDVGVDCGENYEDGPVDNGHGNSAESVRVHSHCGTVPGMCQMYMASGTNRSQASDDVLAHMAAH